MRPRIGWYVHHHGRGHVTRLLAVAPHLDADIVCFSSFSAPVGLPSNCSWVVLDRDDDVPDGASPPGDRDPTAEGLLHWAPLGHAGHRARLATIAAALSEQRMDAMVVDVSVEVVLLARLLGVPTVVVAQPGNRDDGPHALAFHAASRIVAPWPHGVLDLEHLRAVQHKVVYTGGISRFEGRERTAAETARSGVLLLAGAGGSAVSREAVEEAARASGRDWTSLGTGAGSVWTDDPWDALCRAEVVVSWAGQNAVADLAAAGVTAVVVPQERPFDEQVSTARALEANELAVVRSSWPDAADWPAVLDEAAKLDPDWSRWRVAGAARRAAEAIEAVAVGEPAGGVR
ncbi:glycosyltransferase [Plantibacter sp. ME-Dv--P-122b]|uniref:glycosyltransferase n=1 Tax=Plantibacter sp. ME-Dv--P-122b TaxID=3040300 RepID=UPI00254C044B|nr:glycosyltransferase [Plantibacter sp. ME-Dv--P-122b]